MPWLGLLSSPSLLQRRLRTIYAIQDVCLQTQPCWFCNLPLWSRSLSWSHCRQPFPGPFLPSRAQVGFPGLLLWCKVPVNSSRPASLDPWSWPGWGSDVPAFNLPWWLLVPPPPSTGASATTFQSSVASLLDCFHRRWLQDGQWKILCPTPWRLARFFARTGSEKPFVLPPGTWLDFSPATSCFPGLFSGIHQPSTPARSGFWTPSASTQGVSYLIFCSFPCISPDNGHTLPGCSVDAPDHAGSSGLHAGLAGCFLPIHEEQYDGYVGCCSTSAIYGSNCSSEDYEPWWAVAAESLWLLALPLFSLQYMGLYVFNLPISVLGD